MKPFTALVFTLSLLVGSCTTAPTANSPSTGATAAPTPFVGEYSPIATRNPTAPPPVATPTLGPTKPALTLPPASPTPRTDEGPPAARLRLRDGSVVSGKLGSWCYGRGCEDIILGPVEQLPRLELIRAGEKLELSLPTPHRFVHWRAQYGISAGGDEPLDLLAEGGVPYPDPDVVQPSPQRPAPELTAASFRSPPSGSWLLRVELSFAGSQGSAPYYWHAVVP